MNKLFQFLTTLIILSPVFVRADYMLTHPISSTVWHKGKPATIKWKILEKADVTSTTIELLRGDPENLDHIMVISNKVNPNSLAHTWTVKNDLPAGKDYVIQIGEENHKIRYSHKFEIAN